VEYQFTDSLLDRIVDNFKKALKAKQRALKHGKYEDINEFRQRVEYNETILTELKSDDPDLSIFEKSSA
jgi:hypothetical protein